MDSAEEISKRLGGEAMKPLPDIHFEPYTEHSECIECAHCVKLAVGPLLCDIRGKNWLAACYVMRDYDGCEGSLCGAMNRV